MAKTKELKENDLIKDEKRETKIFEPKNIKNCAKHNFYIYDRSKKVFILYNDLFEPIPVSSIEIPANLFQILIPLAEKALKSFPPIVKYKYFF